MGKVDTILNIVKIILKKCLFHELQPIFVKSSLFIQKMAARHKTSWLYTNTVFSVTFHLILFPCGIQVGDRDRLGPLVCLEKLDIITKLYLGMSYSQKVDRPMFAWPFL